MKRKLKTDWYKLWENFFNVDFASELTTDQKFSELVKRIEENNGVIDVVFTGPDCFEKTDNNYWLPEHLFQCDLYVEVK